MLAATAALLAVVVVTFVTTGGANPAPPICQACVGLDFLECHTDLNWGYEDCQTVWVGGVQTCEEGGTTELCTGLP